MTTSSGEGIKSNPVYAAPGKKLATAEINFLFFLEINSPDETTKKHPRMDVWGFALILQVLTRSEFAEVYVSFLKELMTLENPFARKEGRPALFLEICE